MPTKDGEPPKLVVDAPDPDPISQKLLDYIKALEDDFTRAKVQPPLRIARSGRARTYEPKRNDGYRCPDCWFNHGEDAALKMQRTAKDTRLRCTACTFRIGVQSGSG
jgi:DNA-directed RNA polymerase subunit RPC12/RpoP